MKVATGQSLEALQGKCRPVLINRIDVSSELFQEELPGIVRSVWQQILYVQALVDGLASLRRQQLADVCDVVYVWDRDCDAEIPSQASLVAVQKPTFRISLSTPSWS